MGEWGDWRSEVLGPMFLRHSLGTFFGTRTDDSKTQLWSFRTLLGKKGLEKSDLFPTRKFFFCIDNAFKQYLPPYTLNAYRFWWHKNIRNGYTMSNITPPIETPKDVIN
jgi:hypothetical protein